MGRKYFCDLCGEEIEDGKEICYQVAVGEFCMAPLLRQFVYLHAKDCAGIAVKSIEKFFSGLIRIDTHEGKNQDKEAV